MPLISAPSISPSSSSFAYPLSVYTPSLSRRQWMSRNGGKINVRNLRKASMWLTIWPCSSSATTIYGFCLGVFSRISNNLLLWKKLPSSSGGSSLLLRYMVVLIPFILQRYEEVRKKTSINTFIFFIQVRILWIYANISLFKRIWGPHPCEPHMFKPKTNN